jgi:hypothetical protein
LELRQLKLFDECAISRSKLVTDAIEALAKSGGLEERGAVYTRQEVVDFILDLVGYTDKQPLQKKRLLEPSFGRGDFLLPVVRRLLSAWRGANGAKGSALEDLGDAIRAVELHHDSFNSTHEKVVAVLRQDGLPAETGCKVGIGVATGADQAFIGAFNDLNVEPDRKLPLVTTKDIVSGEVNWQGQGVINPFAEGRGLVDLRNYPLLHRYLEARREIIARRHCAQKSPVNWYRTIDRITPVLAKRPKLLIPDIKGEAHVVFESGKFYPHHNLYYVTSDVWDLRALQAVLLSAVTRLFVATYSTKMRGGFLRFQAQYLRRIRLPLWKDVPRTLRVELVESAIKRELEACNRAVFKLYGLSSEERSSLGGNGE